MTEICDYRECTGCTACASICRHGAIVMTEDAEGFLRPVIDSALCVDCGLCKRVCPINDDNCGKEIRSTIIAKSKDRQTLLTSSSGGIFTELCKAWSKDKDTYYIYGAALIDGVVKHIGINNIKDAYVFKGSKYVQSDVRYIFPEIQQKLKGGEHVLFSGTPCQVAGLKDFLIKDYDNLFCVDFVCHGVPSPKVFENYQKYLENKYKSRIRNLFFGRKLNGWINRYFYVEFENNRVYKNFSITNDDPYMTLYFSHYSIRPSCEVCHFTTTRRNGDVTLSDAWGVEKLHPEFDFADGASMVMCSTDKGAGLVDSIKDNICYFEDSVDRYLMYNPQLARPVKFASNRDAILKKAVADPDFYTLFKSGIKRRSFFRRFFSYIKWNIAYKLKNK